MMSLRGAFLDLLNELPVERSSFTPREKAEGETQADATVFSFYLLLTGLRNIVPEESTAIYWYIS